MNQYVYLVTPFYEGRTVYLVYSALRALNVIGQICKMGEASFAVDGHDLTMHTPSAASLRDGRV